VSKHFLVAYAPPYPNFPKSAHPVEIDISFGAFDIFKESLKNNMCLIHDGSIIKRSILKETGFYLGPSINIIVRAPHIDHLKNVIRFAEQATINAYPELVNQNLTRGQIVNIAIMDSPPPEQSSSWEHIWDKILHKAPS